MISSVSAFSLAIVCRSSGVRGAHVVEILRLELPHLFDRHIVEEAVRRRPEIDNLLLDRHRLVLALLEDLGQPHAALDLRAGGRVEVAEPNCANAASERYCARSRRRRPATWRMALIWAAPPTRETEIPTFTAGRMPA